MKVFPNMFSKTVIIVLVFSAHLATSTQKIDIFNDVFHEMRQHFDVINSNLLKYVKQLGETKKTVDKILEECLFKMAKFLAELETNFQNIADGAFIQGLPYEDCLEKFKPHLDNLGFKTNTSCFPGKQLVNAAKELVKVHHYIGQTSKIVTICEKETVDFRICVKSKLEDILGVTSGFELFMNYYLDVALSNAGACSKMEMLKLQADGLDLTFDYQKCLQKLENENKHITDFQ